VSSLRNGGGDPPRYRPTLLDRLGPDGIRRLKVLPAAGAGATIALLAAGFAAHQRGWPLAVTIVVMVLAAAAAGALASIAALKFGDLAGEGVRAFVMPSGASTPRAPDYSREDTLVKRGDIAGALESYEAIISENPGVVDARLRAADLYARQGANAHRAVELFREVQRLPGASPAEDLYASNRLVDLFSGPLRQPGRAIVELRRIQQRHPRSVAAVHAPRAIAELKERAAALNKEWD
jgi:hypothetical protein